MRVCARVRGVLLFAVCVFGALEVQGVNSGGPSWNTNGTCNGSICYGWRSNNGGASWQINAQVVHNYATTGLYDCGWPDSTAGYVWAFSSSAGLGPPNNDMGNFACAVGAGQLLVWGTAAPGCTPLAQECVYHIQWTNNAGVYAAGGGVYVYGDNSTAPFNAGGLIAVKPGGVVDMWVTNTVYNGACGSLWFGDLRPGHDEQRGTFTGTKYNQITGGGQGSNTGGSVPITPVSGAPGGGTTNLASQNDVYVGANAVVGAVAAVGRAVEDGTKVVTNGLADVKAAVTDVKAAVNQVANNGTNQYNALLNLNSNLQSGFGAMVSGLTNGLGGLGTNLAGLGTNVGNGLGTNVSGDLGSIRTNVQYLADSVRVRSGGVSNAFGLLTNDPAFAVSDIGGSVGVVSNRWSEFTNAMGGVDGLGPLGTNGFVDGLTGAKDAWQTWKEGGGVYVPDDWAVYPIGDGISLDLKRVIDLSVLEDATSCILIQPGSGYSSVRVPLRKGGPETRLTGSLEGWGWGVPNIRPWIKMFLLWGILVGFMISYGTDLRLAIRDVLLTPNPDKTADTIQWMGACLLGTVATGNPLGGAAAGGVAKVAQWMIKAGTVLFLVTVVVFAPSILVALGSTAAQLGSSIVSFMGSANSTIIGGMPAPVGRTLTLLQVWFSAVEFFMFTLNYLLARLALGATVSFLMGFVRAQGI